MSDILSRIYHGDYFPQERPFFPDRSYYPKSSQAADMEDRFEEALPDDLKNQFREYLHMGVEMDAMEEEAAFIEGVRFGVRIMIAVLGDRA